MTNFSWLPWRPILAWLKGLSRTKPPAFIADVRAVQRPSSAEAGAIWIDAAGNIRVRNPGSHGKTYAVLEIPTDAPITVTLNGLVVQGLHVITEQDDIHYTLHQQPPLQSWTVDVDEHGLKADVIVRYAAGWRAHLTPCTPCPHLVLHPQKIPWEPDEIPATAVEAELNRRHIIEGRIPEQDLVAFLRQRQSGRLRVADGIPPQPGERAPIAWTEVIHGTDERSVHVPAGTVLGRILPAHPGKPGRTVFGTPITPPEVSTPVMTWGSGVMRTDTGDIVATHAGRIQWSPTHLEVIPETVLTQLEDTPSLVLISGDAALVGSWHNATILATGRIRSTEPIDHCVVRAQEGVDLTGRIAHSQVFIGPTVLSDYLRYLVEQVLRDLASLERTMQALQAHAPVTVRLHYGALLVQVLHDKFPGLLSTLDVAHRLLALIEAPAMIRDSIATLTHLTSEASLRQYTELTAVMACQTRLHEALTDWMPPPVSAETITSELGLLRDCIVRGAGVLVMRAADACEIDGADALRVRESLIGGFCRIGHRVQARQLGHPRGTETVVQTLDSTGIVEVDHLYPGTVIVVGTQRHFIRSILQHVVVDGEPEQVEML
ncbi:MAG: hypothetical protein C7B47_11865 [Sulfobacillus thermosulfidooxidans]|uniref:Flagellar Assembly Protein A N-terminal region domain-containing protein n=1 Tax=Sulfobacillus thermosulfidooxidans TaxID=28034 RepID=A0A2T2WTK5_SULTH|nr:MAG: hypothetical protein C7B47_11865 [Sulfobacillus thermosulfidooxidans]